LGGREIKAHRQQGTHNRMPIGNCYALNYSAFVISGDPSIRVKSRNSLGDWDGLLINRYISPSRTLIDGRNHVPKH
jgi:hypothetical protein